MGNYMIDISLPETYDPEFMELIPKQRAFTYIMMKKGVIINYSLSVDRKKLWVIIAAESKREVKNILGSFPIFNYIRFTIHNLLFHESREIAVPHFWLN